LVLWFLAPDSNSKHFVKSILDHRRKRGGMELLRDELGVEIPCRWEQWIIYLKLTKSTYFKTIVVSEIRLYELLNAKI